MGDGRQSIFHKPADIESESLFSDSHEHNAGRKPEELADTAWAPDGPLALWKF